VSEPFKHQGTEIDIEKPTARTLDVAIQRARREADRDENDKLAIPVDEFGALIEHHIKVLCVKKVNGKEIDASWWENLDNEADWYQVKRAWEEWREAQRAHLKN
jgi:hypothetical protein